METMKVLFVYGSSIALAILFLAGVAVYLVCRGNRYFMPRGWQGWVTFCVAAIVALPAGAYLLWITPLRAAYPKLNQPAPELGFRLVDVGAARNLHDYKGKVILLNVWATHCKACVAEMPDLSRLHQQYASQGVVVITVSQDPPSSILKFDGFKSMRGVNAYVDGGETSVIT
jgi:thiol-disulfide isomerase/thioredoxin